MLFRLLAPLPLLLPLMMPVHAFAQADPPPAKYECWHFTTPLPGMAFTIKGGGQYIDVDGKSGTYTAANGQIAFKGGAYDGQRAIFKSGRPPTIAILGPSGSETETCQPGG